MVRVNTTDFVALRNLLKEDFPGKEGELLARLSPQMAEIYKKTSFKDWIQIPQVIDIYQQIVDLLFPGEQDGWQKLGSLIARRSFSGAYRIFLGALSIDFVIKRAANIWNAYYDQGFVEVENIRSRSCDFVLKEFPELPSQMRHLITGHMTAILELTGAKNITITLDESGAKDIKWFCRWGK
jgi:hypothetical protein